MGQQFWDAFWLGVQSAAAGLWAAMLANPWLFLLFGGMVAASLWMQLRPSRRRSR
jgi:hypothetical protein